jgi:hypothetical protein
VGLQKHSLIVFISWCLNNHRVKLGLHWTDLYEGGEFLECLSNEQLLADGLQHMYIHASFPQLGFTKLEQKIEILDQMVHVAHLQQAEDFRNLIRTSSRTRRVEIRSLHESKEKDECPSK